MKKSIQQKMGMGFVLIIVLVVAGQFMAYQSLSNFLNSSNKIVLIQDVLEDVTSVKNTLNDVESEQRGYILLGSELYLEDYQELSLKLKNELPSLKKSTQYTLSPDAYKELEALVDQRLNFLDEGIRIRQEQGIDKALAYIKQNKGRKVMQLIIYKLDEVKINESEILDNWQGISEDRANNMKQLFIFSTAMIVGILMWLLVTLNREIASRQKTEKALLNSQERYKLIASGTNDGLWDWEISTGKVYFSPRWKAILGFKPNETFNDIYDWFKTVEPNDMAQLVEKVDALKSGETKSMQHEYRMIKKSGEIIWVKTLASGAYNEKGNCTRIAGSLSDINTQKVYEYDLNYKASHDPLTGLYNRNELMEHLNKNISLSRRYKLPLSLVLTDLNKFKHINDTYGHLLGDEVLVSYAKLLQRELRNEDIMARFGGDEFCILLPNTPSKNAEILMKRVQLLFSETIFNLPNGDDFRSAISFGIAELEDSMDAKILMELADKELYKAKAALKR